MVYVEIFPQKVLKVSLDAVYDMKNVALERLQERQERVMLLVEGLDLSALQQLSSNAL